MELLVILIFCRVMYLVCTPHRVRFTRYQEWSFTNADGSPRGVVVIDPEWQSSPDYREPDAVRRYE